MASRLLNFFHSREFMYLQTKLSEKHEKTWFGATQRIKQGEGEWSGCVALRQENWIRSAEDSAWRNLQEAYEFRLHERVRNEASSVEFQSCSVSLTNICFIQGSTCLKRRTRGSEICRNIWRPTSAISGSQKSQQRKLSAVFGLKIIWRGFTRLSRYVPVFRLTRIISNFPEFWENIFSFSNFVGRNTLSGNFQSVSYMMSQQRQMRVHCQRSFPPTMTRPTKLTRTQFAFRGISKVERYRACCWRECQSSVTWLRKQRKHIQLQR